MVKNLPASAGDFRDTGSIPGLGRSPGGGHGNPLQYSCLENPHVQRSLAGYSPWGRTESDTTKATYKGKHGASQVALVIKNLPASAGDVRDEGSIPGLGRSSWRRAWQPTLVFLPGRSPGQRTLAGYSP